MVGYIPNCPEAIEAMAATAAIGKKPVIRQNRSFRVCLTLLGPRF